MILLDQVTFCITKIPNPYYVMSLDLDSFDSLYASLKRNEALDMTDLAWLHTTATVVGMTGEVKLMKDFVKKYQRWLTKDEKKDKAAFIKRIGKGY